MALSANTVWEVRTDGDDGNGGGFVAGASGTDRSQQAAAHATLTTASVVHTTTTQINVHASNHTVGAADVGNILQITGGSGTAGFYEIKSVDAGNNRWTVDRAAGTAGQTVAGKMGGALGSPGKLSSVPTVDGMYAHVRAGTYTITTATPGSGGPLSLTNGWRVTVEGYSATRGDLGPGPVLFAGTVGGITIVNLLNTNSTEEQKALNLVADGNGQANTNGFSGLSLRNGTYQCTARNCTTGYLFGRHVSGRAINCTTGFAAGGGATTQLPYCWADGCGDGFNTSGDEMVFVGCLATDCMDDGFDIVGLNRHVFVNCTSDGNGGDGFDVDGGVPISLVNCVATNNGGVGYRVQATTELWKCASFGNTSGRLAGTPRMDVQPVTLSATPYVDAAGGDFRLNAAAGGGALLRGTGVGVYGQADAKDIGAITSAVTLPAANKVKLGSGDFGYAGALVTPAYYPPNFDAKPGVEDVAAVLSGAHYGETNAVAGTGTGGIAPEDIVAAEWVVVGHANYTGGQAGTYPTSATSMAAQYAADQAAVGAQAASILDTATILGVAGTFPISEYCLIAGITWPLLDEVDGGRKFGPITGEEYEGTGVNASTIRSLLTIQPTQAMLQTNGRITPSALIAYQSCQITLGIPVVDAAGDPVDLTGRTLSMKFFDKDDPETTIYELRTDGASPKLTISGSQAIAEISTTMTATRRVLQWRMFDVDLDVPLADGWLDIKAGPAPG